MMHNRLAKDRPGSQQNAILAALSAAELERVATDLELVPLKLGQVLYNTGEIMSHAFFPIDSIASILYVMQNGESAETAIVGNDGIIGVLLFLGGESTQSRAIVQNAGHAYRLKAQTLKFAI
jgi:CRP-like cAMP-binding protein